MRRSVLAPAVVLLAGLVGCGGESGPAPEAPATVSAGAEEPAPSVELAPRFRRGEVSTYIQSELRVQGQSSPLHTALREAAEARVFDLETLEATAEGVRLRLTMRRVASTLRENGAPVYRYDSAEERGDRDLSGPSRARELLVGLVAEARLSPDGRVISMTANLTREQVLSIPNSLRPLLAENWARAVIESIFRPYGETRTIPEEGAAERSAGAQSPLEGTLVQTVRVSGRGEGRALLESETVLEGPGGEPKPGTYRQRTLVAWSAALGRVDELLRREEVRLEREMAGVEAVERIDRRFFITRVNSSDELDETERSMEDLLGPDGSIDAEAPSSG